MVRDATRRKAKYDAKIDADVQRSRILAQKDAMVSNAEGAFANLAQIETEIKAAIQGLSPTIYSPMIPSYLNVGRQLYKLQNKYSGTTFTGESTLMLDKWKARGLATAALTAIAKLFGVTYS